MKFKPIQSNYLALNTEEEDNTS